MTTSGKNERVTFKRTFGALRIGHRYKLIQSMLLVKVSSILHHSSTRARSPSVTRFNDSSHQPIVRIFDLVKYDSSNPKMFNMQLQVSKLLVSPGADVSGSVLCQLACVKLKVG